MSTFTWRAPGSNVSLVFHGRLRFEDVAIPFPSKDEWGVDTMERTMRGPIYLLETFLSELQQGSQHADWPGFHLQSWQVAQHPYAPTVTLAYKGFTKGIPDPTYSNTREEVCGSIQASDLEITIPSLDLEIVSATKEIKYYAPATLYRYITNTEPEEPRFNTARGPAVRIIDSRIIATYNDGSTQLFTGLAPAALVTALHAEPEAFTIGPIANPIIGTPYWECEEVVQLRYPTD